MKTRYTESEVNLFMRRKTSSTRHIHTIIKVGRNSVGVIIPIEFARDLKWQEKKKVLVRKSGRRVIIQNISKKDIQQKLF